LEFYLGLLTGDLGEGGAEDGIIRRFNPCILEGDDIGAEGGDSTTYRFRLRVSFSVKDYIQI
jgi:hypothetical protein